jgi:ABC-type transport system involved in multi-copper enzyme maturation permease subunit
MKASFTLAWHALVRSHVLTLLLVATALAHAFLPAIVRSDGTSDGWREMFVRAVPGSAYFFIAATILSCACGFFAQERERFRLSLTIVRPASAFGVAVGKWLALCAVSAAALVFSAMLTACRLADAPSCLHHHSPRLPPAVECARAALAAYLTDPATPEAVRRAPRAAVLSLLANKETDRYDTVRSGESFVWPFDASLASETGLVVRARFATQFELRSPFEGEFSFGGFKARISHSTQSSIDVPLTATTNTPSATSTSSATLDLVFRNNGREAVMLRPRRDLLLLTPADAFGWNLARATLQMLSTTALLAAFGMFLSAAVSRPVAIFTAVVAVAVTMMAPSVVAQFPDEMNTKLSERFGLAISRAICTVTSTVSESQPVSDLATGTCIEWQTLARSLAVNVAAVPAALLAIASLIIRRKPLAENS